MDPQQDKPTTTVTSGPAKWAAIGALGGAAAIGLVWSLSTHRRPIQDPPPSSPKQTVPIAASAPPPKPEATKKININTATASQLQDLPHIGPALAAAIIAYRTSHGPFRIASDLDKVPGIGPKTVEQIRPLVTTD